MTYSAEIVAWQLVDKDGNKIPQLEGMMSLIQADHESKVLGHLLKQQQLYVDSQRPGGAPHRYEPLVKKQDADCAIHHWKANHDNQVDKARVLMERTDLPLERTRAYKTIGRLQDAVTDLRNKLFEANKRRIDK